MDENITSRLDFSAGPSLSGYLFQCRYALLESLRKIKKDISFTVSIETFDDVVFDVDGDAIELLQTKHHYNQTTNLTDASPDLWKTIRIWCEFYKNENNPKGATFFIITTSSTSENSIARLLKPGNERNVQAAVACLNAIARTSTNKENIPAYEVFQSLNEVDKLTLFNDIYIFDSNPILPNLDDEIREVVFFAVESKYLDAFMKRLEGWWFRRVIRQISQAIIEPILGEEISSELTYIREEFKAENLPIDDDILSSVINEVDFYDRMFVQQLHLINVSNKRIFFAIRDYFRAFTQRSRWLREDLLYIGELERYERRLLEEGEIHFEGMAEALGEEATEEEKVRIARELYQWVEQGNLLQIRGSVSEPSIPRGSYHILAEDLKLGWHIEFTDRLRVLLEA